MLKACRTLITADGNPRLHALYDCLAPLYFLIHPFVRMIARRAAELVPSRSRLNVLDVATGTGILARALAERGHQVVGADLSMRMLRQAGRVRQRLAIPSVQADARNLAFADGSFDLCSISMALHEFSGDDRRRILSEMVRISRRYVLVADFDGPQWLPVRLAERMEHSHYRDFEVQGSLGAVLTEAGLVIERRAHHVSIGSCLCRIPESRPSRLNETEES